MSLVSCIILFVVTLYLIPHSRGSPHSIFHHFETLNPNQIILREKRAASGSRQPVLTGFFEAFNKRFNMLLTPGARILHPRVKAELVDSTGAAKPFNLHNNRFYSGFLVGQETHQVDASETEGVWMIHIHTPDEFYAVEPMSFYDGNAEHSNLIVYRSQDIKTHNETVKSPFCKDFAFKDLNKNPKNHNNRQPEIFNLVNMVAATLRSKKKKFRGPRYMRHAVKRNSKQFEQAFTEREKQQHRSGGKSARSVRTKIYTKHAQYDAPKECDLVAVAGYTLYKGIGMENPSRIVQTLVHVYSIVDKVFRSTDFGDGFGDGYGIVLRGMLIHTDYSNSPNHYNTADPFADAETILIAMSREAKFFPYCLAHLTTQQDMEDILGLASRASPTVSWDNGICAGINYHISRNVGISTVISPTKDIASLKMYSQVVAHEIGHNWGAEHDPMDPSMWLCNPDTNNGGKYLMWPHAVLAKDLNALTFSPCSRDNVRAVLKSRAHKCFLNRNALKEICGNGLVDPSEECDPGYDKHHDPCCQYNCGLRRRAECSFRNSPCCTVNCTIAPSSQLCYPEGGLQECYQASNCLGNDATHCPAPKPLPNGTPCEQE
ncbi:hypothetical protein EGW08_013374, partial [Elysia chlorotica]